jgi:hypothetical protein
MKEEYLVYVGLGIFAFILIMLMLNNRFTTKGNTTKGNTTEGLENMDNTSKSANLAGDAVAHLELLKKANEDLTNRLLLDNEEPSYKEMYENMVVELDKYCDFKSVELMTNINTKSDSKDNIIKQMAEINTISEFKTSLNHVAEYLNKR